MKLSTNFVKDYVDVDVNLKQLAEDMTRVGNEYDSAERLINATKLVIGEIVECTAHPDSDHLHLCKVNVGNEILNIVCGAPNARKGLKVIVALDGAELPGKTIKKGMIRGQESNGMLCSIAELGLEHKFLKPEDSEGIAELGEDAVIGEDPIKYMQMDDGVIDFELTANRGDLLSILGMAYEVGAIYDKKVKDVDLKHKESGEDINKTLKTEVKTANCSKLLVKKVENVKIEESPIFIKNRLIASGIRPINNVVDISNYVMLELGQPLHFYDADRLGNKLVVRMAEEGEKLTTLDNIERTLSADDIVIADSTHGVGLAGVMGGLETEVEPDTKNIIIESAIFDSVKVRKTSKKIVRSEASNRFEKGLDPNRTYMAIERSCNLLQKYAGDLPLTFILSILICGTLEYMTSYVMEKIFKARWWDYSQRKFNINGRICLETLIPFGIAGTFILYIANPFIMKYINMIPELGLHIFTVVFLLIYVTDMIVSFKIILNLKEMTKEFKDNTIEISTKVKKIIRKKLPRQSQQELTSI